MKDHLKVLHLSASDQGGAYLFANNLVRNFQNPNFHLEHKVYSGKNENISFTGIRQVDRLIKFSLHVIEKVIFRFYEKDKSIRFKFSLGYPGIPFFIFKKLSKDYDIIHLHWINKGFININHLKKINKPIVWTCHDIWPVTGGCHLTFGCENYKTNCGNCPFLKHPSKKDISYRQLKNKEYIYKDLNLTFVSPSAWMFQNIKKSSLGEKHNLILINNGIDTTIFKYFNIRNEINKYTIGFVAANLNDENKALFRLAKAISLLKNKHEYKLLLIGKQKTKFEFNIDIEYQIITNIDEAHKMAEIYQVIDLLVVPSTLETFPTTIMEASCCGVNSIGFDVGGIREIVDKIGGKIIEPFNIEEMSNAICMYKNNFHDRSLLSLKSIEIFGINKTVTLYQNLYKRLINQ